ncbi:ligand-binding SRPBCC domain-containing protein [Mucilaginibacter yixingensis]|uniref:Ligand-binding SRPBCC domain-containing protein n=1 Tax=Mucilaginibacter yixingensis TaxID=1295612 RepID=A0A2T5J4Y7_9SPHI|nr:SRPBCC family protein [Mucilaginibacter yixingensis]PTQ92889.1 ligand-binding SRPBCC domain-containing protein [Mucilaginibacter yixingensis]
MKTYLLTWQQDIPISVAEAWEFFRSPLNLAKITPDNVKFKVTSPYTAHTQMYPGMIITYKISPFLGVEMDWMTEITHVQDQQYFVDEQRFGPYALWHHQHHFEAIPGGTRMRDILNYAIPYGPIGRLANNLFVEKQIRQIFEFREEAIRKMFPPAP